MAVHPGSIWLDDHWDSLPKGYWVAAGPDGIVAQDLDLPNVYRNLNSKNVPLDDVTIAYIPPDIIIQ